MQCAGFNHFIKLTAQAHQLVINGTTVRFNLRLTWSTNKAQATTLTFKVGPSTHKTCTLIGECRHFDLQHALTGGRTFAKYFKDQTGAVQDLHAPLFFKVALLNRRNFTIDQNKVDFCLFKHVMKLFDLTRAK